MATRTDTDQRQTQVPVDRGRLVPFSQLPVTWWSTVVGGALALALGVALLAGVWLLAHPLALIVIGATLAAALAPAVDWAERWMPRTLAIVLVHLVLVIILVGILFVVIPPLYGQLVDFSMRVPQLLERAENFAAGRLALDLQRVTDMLVSEIGQITSTLLQLPAAIFGFFAAVVLILFISLYGLIEAPAIRRFVLSLVPDDENDRAENTLGRMLQAMGGYVRGSAIDGVIVGIVTYLGLLVIGADFALVLGLLAAVLEIVPVIGPIILATLAVGLSLLQSPTQALIVLIFMVVLQQVENHILVPNIMHGQTNISPLLAVLALVAGAAIGGVLGALVAIPLAAALRVFVVDVVAPAVRNWGEARHERHKQLVRSED